MRSNVFLSGVLEEMRLRPCGLALGQLLRLAGDFLSRRPVGAHTPPWLPVLARHRRTGERSSPERYGDIIDQFAIEANTRYRRNAQGRGETYCNIFVWDVTRAMGAEIPHWVTDRGTPTRPLHGFETNANAAIDWLHERGRQHGWRAVEMRQAQSHANRGAPAIAVWRNDLGIGHMAVVRPGPITADGPLVADVGETNRERTRAAHAFTRGWQNNELVYFAHD